MRYVSGVKELGFGVIVDVHHAVVVHLSANERVRTPGIAVVLQDLEVIHRGLHDGAGILAHLLRSEVIQDAVLAEGA